MTAITLPKTKITAGFLPLEDDWGVAMNYMLRLFDALLMAEVADKDLAAPPGSPASGDTYIIAAGASGAWSGHTGDIAVWMAGDDLSGSSGAPPSAWNFIDAREGWRVWVADEDMFYQFNGTAWIAKPEVDPSNVAINSQSGTTYTLVLSDAGKCVRQGNATAITTTVPPNSDVAFPIGSTISFRQVSSGQITLNPGSGVTLNAPDSFLAKTGRQGASMMIHKVGTNEWDVTGDLGV